MAIHAHTELFKSTIIIIPNNKASLSNSDNYLGFCLFNSICKVFDHVIKRSYNPLISSLDTNHICEEP